MKMRFMVTGLAILAFSSAVLAAKPTSISYSSDATTSDGENYANYVVKCSNGKSMPLTAWQEGRQWCVGEESKELCHTKQLKAAKAACKIN